MVVCVFYLWKKGGNVSRASAPVWRSVTDFLFDWQLEFPTRASTQTSTGLSMITWSLHNMNQEVLMSGKLFR